MAIDRLLRFIASHEKVFERVDDSSGAIQDVYYRAITALGELVPSLREEELALLPDRIMAGLGQSSHGYLVDVAEEVMEPLPDDVLRIWDAELKALVTAQEVEDAKSKDRFVFSNIHQYRSLRQLIADRLGDLDGLIALEELKHPNSQDIMAIAERLLEAGRLPEALDWVRQKKTGGLKVMGYTDLADGLMPRDADNPRRISLEARILEALDDKKDAQKLRWSVFETSLDSAILREYLAALPDFEEFDALDRAFDHGLMSKQIYTALVFFMEWPELSFAAKLVIAHRGEWDGGQYYLLPTAADALQHEYALASTILYRALLDDILSRARSKAYKHGAHYLDRLDSLADQADREAKDLEGFQTHANYRANLQTKHARKSSFWAQVK
nr:DUF6880 family protein [Cohaesibacter sp. ES.047]